MKTRTKIFYPNNGQITGVDSWVAETPGEVKDVRVSNYGNYGIVMVVMYEVHDNTDWGPG